MNLITDWPLSLAAWERSKASLSGGVSTGLRASMPPHPLSFERGQGSQLFDIDGNRYTDYVLGWGPVFLGHSHPEVVQAVAEQLPRGQTFGSGHALEYEVAERIVEFVPGAERVLWSNTGTEADQSAFRLARAFTGRQRILKFAGHYHGWQDNMLVSYRGAGATQHPEPGAGTRGQSSAAMSDVRVARFNDLESVRVLLENKAEDIAAVVLEPLLANSGVLVPEPGFLEGLRDLCTRTGTVLIFDEVITGFRLAMGGAAEYFGVTPDLTVMAKSIAAGFSLAAIAGRADIIDQVNAGVVHAGTYNGNPIVLSAAKATLDYLARERPHATLAGRAQRLASGMSDALAAAGIRGHAHAVGPIAQLALGIDRLSDFEQYLQADWAAYDELIVALLRRGQFVLPGGRWYLSTAHTEADIDQTIAAFTDALHDLALSPGSVESTTSSAAAER
jgi:glutamate-1-semialdehyde 2,1-aminomutase